MKTLLVILSIFLSVGRVNASPSGQVIDTCRRSDSSKT